MEIKIIPDKYEILARIFPAIIVLIPFLIFTMNCDISMLSVFFNDLLKVKIIGNITIALILLYLLSQTNRFFGKFLFEMVMFKDELEMPTTRFLLFSDSKLSKRYKLQIREKIKVDFNNSMPTEEDKRVDLLETKKRIVEAVSFIREKVKKGRHLLQHNIEYGFARNLIGGSIIGLFVSIFDIVYFYSVHSNPILYISAFSACFFIGLLLCNKPIINHLGNQYAKRLFSEYLNK